ncbi:hypothetical protein [Pseudoalteromonas sp.]|uniref:hypothetical protein n=1 Tax=Pseudoalteromonas sp. TaxID=53249 RepID=UPI003565CB82
MSCTNIRQDDIGRIFAIDADFDLSGNTELRVVFTKPDGTIVEKLKADGVTAPGVDLTICVDGVDQTFLANEYFQYSSEAGLLDLTGSWTIHGEYVDATPKDLSGDVSRFTVLPRE